MYIAVISSNQSVSIPGSEAVSKKNTFPQVEKLIQEMKTANLESLTISPPEESKAFLDGELDTSSTASSPPPPGTIVIYEKKNLD